MSVMAVAKATGKMTLALLQFFLREVRRLVFCLLFGFELRNEALRPSIEHRSLFAAHQHANDT